MTRNVPPPHQPHGGHGQYGHPQQYRSPHPQQHYGPPQPPPQPRPRQADQYDHDQQHQPQPQHQSQPHRHAAAPPPPPPPPARKRRVWPWVLLGVLIALVGLPVACTAMVGGAISTAVDSASGPVTIRYELTGDGEATSITWSQDGGTGQEANGALPWSKTVEFANGFLAPVSLTGQNGSGSGSITCKITNETTGRVIAESTSSGQYAVVSCFGTANEPAGS